MGDEYDTLHGYAEMNGKLVAEIEALRAENARLRLALRGVLSGVNGATSAPTDVQMISVGALELDDEDD